MTKSHRIPLVASFCHATLHSCYFLRALLSSGLIAIAIPLYVIITYSVAKHNSMKINIKCSLTKGFQSILILKNPTR